MASLATCEDPVSVDLGWLSCPSSPAVDSYSVPAPRALIVLGACLLTLHECCANEAVRMELSDAGMDWLIWLELHQWI
ncbi:hypothetical protein [Nonomuraea bangladeshensis]|uniref:hypothetical protein n=1 Tax=Nonomuraea bangladeshensis TaxID=404385 RepID=UPI003C3034F0